MISGPVDQEKAATFAKIFISVGVLVIGVGLFIGADSIRLLAQGATADGKVLSVSDRWLRGPRQTERTALVEFRVAGQVHRLERSWTLESGSFWTWPNYQPGEALRVIYLPSDPQHAKILSLAELLLFPLFFAGAGLAFLGFGIFCARVSRSGDAPDGTAADPGRSIGWSAIAFALLVVGGGAFYYYFGVHKFDIEHAAREREAVAAKEAAEHAKAEAQAKAMAALYAEAARKGEIAAAEARAAPVAAWPGMSECEALLLSQRNLYAEKYRSSAEFFFNIRAPKDVDCPSCRENLAYRFRDWIRVPVAKPAYQPTDYRAGCVAYRADLFGSARGAECIVDFIGHKYTADQSCPSDAFPYTITHLPNPW